MNNMLPVWVSTRYTTAGRCSASWRKRSSLSRKASSAARCSVSSTTTATCPMQVSPDHTGDVRTRHQKTRPSGCRNRPASIYGARAAAAVVQLASSRSRSSGWHPAIHPRPSACSRGSPNMSRAVSFTYRTSPSGVVIATPAGEASAIARNSASLWRNARSVARRAVTSSQSASRA